MSLLLEALIKRAFQRFNPEDVKSLLSKDFNNFGPGRPDEIGVGLMTPTQFLQLTPELNSAYSTHRASRLQDLMKAGTPMEDIPFLQIQRVGQDLSVYGHEGRHRALAAQNLGDTVYPVRLLPPSAIGAEERPLLRQLLMERTPIRTQDVVGGQRKMYNIQDWQKILGAAAVPSVPAGFGDNVDEYRRQYVVR